MIALDTNVLARYPFNDDPEWISRMRFMLR